MRTVATFRSAAFNSSEEREYFINSGCFGDDLAQWMIQRLRESDVQTDEQPGQEDFGWYFNFEAPDGRHCCIVGFRPGDENGEGLWVIFLERSRGLVRSLLGGRNRGITGSAVHAVHGILTAAPEISELRWYDRKDFDEGREDLGRPTPASAVE